MINKRKTAGQLAIKAASDPTKYDSLEVGHALCADVLSQLQICIEKHKPIINEDEFCVVMILADDPLIKGVLRRKFYAWPYLPKPRPRQSVFLYRKGNNSIIRLWVLPDALSMATSAEMVTVSPQWQTMKDWSRAFFHGWKYFKDQDRWINTTPSHFFDVIRKQHDINMLSEHEYLNVNREKLIQAGCQEMDTPFTEAFDFSKISIEKIIDTKTAVSN